jgi:hypothetical protein
MYKIELSADIPILEIAEFLAQLLLQFMDHLPETLPLS